MIRTVNIEESMKIRDYELYASLYNSVRNFMSESEVLLPKLKDRKIWMINSTETGGGVAEMMPTMISIFRQIGLNIDWAVMETTREEFFHFTKKLHNLIHGAGKPIIHEADRDMYEDVIREAMGDFIQQLKDDDIVVIHDPQPMGMAAAIRKAKPNVELIWRSHIGLDQQLPQTEVAWSFLKPYFKFYDHSVFSAPEYIPPYLSGNVSIIHPGIDPLSHKNRELKLHKLVGILANAGLLSKDLDMVTPPFEHQVKRLKGDGTFGSANEPVEIGILTRPTITQISRWDKLKGFQPLIEGFAHLKKHLEKYSAENSPRERKRLKMVKLVLGGPDPAFVKDDPEGQEVLAKLIDFYKELPPELQDDIALLSLPMHSRKENALIVNALQRCSTMIVQNSLQEGFGLTATEGMWKTVPLLVSNACGLRQQVVDKIHGRMIEEPENTELLAEVMGDMLADVSGRDLWASNAQRRVIDNFLVFTQIRNWLNVFVQAS